MPPEASCLWQKGRLIGKMYFDQDYYCKWTNKHRDGGLGAVRCVWRRAFFLPYPSVGQKIILNIDKIYYEYKNLINISGISIENKDSNLHVKLIKTKSIHNVLFTINHTTHSSKTLYVVRFNVNKTLYYLCNHRYTFQLNFATKYWSGFEFSLFSFKIGLLVL